MKRERDTESSPGHTFPIHTFRQPTSTPCCPECAETSSATRRMKPRAQNSSSSSGPSPGGLCFSRFTLSFMLCRVEGHNDADMQDLISETEAGIVAVFQGCERMHTDVENSGRSTPVLQTLQEETQTTGVCIVTFHHLSLWFLLTILTCSVLFLLASCATHSHCFRSCHWQPSRLWGWIHHCLSQL